MLTHKEFSNDYTHTIKTHSCDFQYTLKYDKAATRVVSFVLSEIYVSSFNILEIRKSQKFSNTI